ncbi:MAG: bifunctional oligoribonuclease/PAP phosphatase NrnA [Bacteroidota bacterium]
MEQIEDLQQLLATPKSIVITSHRNPDGDAIGSSLAMYFYLNQLGHTVRMVLPSEYPEFLDWMPSINDIIVYDIEQERSKELIKDANIVFCLDFNSLDRIDKLGESLHNDSAAKVVMIDHHLDPEPFADFVLSDPSASSTCELVYDFLLMLDEKDKIDTTLAESIMTGILTDTGSFRYGTSPKLYRTVADLIELGVDDYKLQDLITNSLKEKHLRLLGHCLNNRMEIMEEYHTGIIYLTKQDYARFAISRGDTEGIVNYILKIKQIKMAAFIMEQPTIVKISLRSKGSFSVQEIAQKYFRGGGHKNASGGASYKGLKSTIRQFKELLPRYEDQLRSATIDA